MKILALIFLISFSVAAQAQNQYPSYLNTMSLLKTLNPDGTTSFRGIEVNEGSMSYPVANTSYGIVCKMLGFSQVLEGPGLSYNYSYSQEDFKRKFSNCTPSKHGCFTRRINSDLTLGAIDPMTMAGYVSQVTCKN